MTSQSEKVPYGSQTIRSLLCPHWATLLTSIRCHFDIRVDLSLIFGPIPFVTLHVITDGASGWFDRTSDNSNTIRSYIAFPWFRYVPEGISSAGWGQKGPAGSHISCDSVRRRKRDNSRTEEAVREGRSHGEHPHVTSGWVGRTNN